MLRSKILLQIPVVLAVQLAFGSNARGALIDITSAEQQVGGGIGYAIGGTSHTTIAQLDPDPDPQGAGDADLGVSLDAHGISLSDTLTTVFLEDQVAGSGAAFASAEWGSQPSGADDVHGGGASAFTLSFSRESSPTYFSVAGQIEIDVEGDPEPYPEETFAYVRLSCDDGGGATIVWEETWDGGSGDASIPFDHGLWLEADHDYRLEAHAEAGTMADVTHSAWKSRTASFSFAATAEPVQLDIDWICMTSSKTHTDGVVVADPWRLEIWIYVLEAGSLDHVDIFAPGSTEPFATLYEDDPVRWGDFNSDSYPTYASLRAAHPEGEYTFKFCDSSDGVLATVVLDYSDFPGGPTGPAIITYPTHTATNVSTNPTVTWEAPPGDPGALTMAIQDDVTDVDVYEALAPTTTTSWTPGPLEPDRQYDLDMSACEVKDWTGTGWPTMTVGDDTFSYTLMIEYLNGATFTTGAVPEIDATLDIIGDTMTPKTKWITCHLWLPEGHDAGNIDLGSIRLGGGIPAVRASVRKQQQMLVAKFAASDLKLAASPDPYLLTVSGRLVSGATFAGSDDVTVIEKGGKKK